MKYLATYDGASAAELVQVKSAAVRGCIGAVKAPIVSFTEQVCVCVSSAAMLSSEPMRGV